MNGKLRKLAVIGTLLAAATLGATAGAQGPGGGPGYGPGMMGGGPGYGPGMMGGYGPGMMGGYGPGYGAGGGFGPGRGYGTGMERLEALKLSDEQREKVLAIREETRQKNWPAMGQLRTERFKLRSMMKADTVDANAVVDQQKKIDELRLQLLRSRVEARNQIYALLTPEQRKQFRQLGPWGSRGGA